MKIVSWQSLLTEHQYHTWMALQALDDDISFVLGKLESRIREQHGWKKLDVSNLDTQVLPPKSRWKTGKKIIQQNLDAVHVFGGFWADWHFFPLLLFAVGHGVKVVIMNESYSEDVSGYLSEEAGIVSRIKVLLRPILYRLAIRIINIISKGNRPCFFALGAQAAERFTHAGFNEDQIFPFGYFVPKRERIKSKQKRLMPTLNLIFVGALLKRKGLDIALKAVNAINKQGKETAIVLDIYGSGNPDKWLVSTYSGATYKGVIPFETVQSVIAQYDFLILPSRHDGWGVVVNEALLQGIPVIISDQVGAKSLVDTTGAGVVFKSGASDDLELVLHDLERNRALQTALRNSAESIASKILPEAAAKYMEDVLNFFFFHQGERPKEIWRT